MWARPDSFLPRSLWSRGQEWGFAVYRPLAGLFAVSLAAWIGVLPFTLSYLHLASPSAVLVNLAVVPLAYGVLANGVLSLLASPLSNLVAAVFNNTNLILARGILALVQLFARLPGGHFYFELPRWNPPLCEITVFDLGGGDAIHLRAGGRDWVIDSGAQHPYGEIVLPYLHSRGVNGLEGLIITRGSAKANGAATECLNDLSPRRILQSPLSDKWRGRAAFEAAMKACHVSPETIQRGDLLRLAQGVELRVIYPPPDLLTHMADDKALVLQMEAGGFKVLFVPGGGFFVEHWLLDHERDLKSDVLVRGEQGPDASLDLVDAVGPAAVVCASSRYAEGQIPESWAAGVAARGIRLFRQDQTGAVRVDLRAGDLRLKSFLGNQTFREQKPANRATLAP